MWYITQNFNPFVIDPVAAKFTEDNSVIFVEFVWELFYTCIATKAIIILFRHHANHLHRHCYIYDKQTRHGCKSLWSANHSRHEKSSAQACQWHFCNSRKLKNENAQVPRTSEPRLSSKNYSNYRYVCRFGSGSIDLTYLYPRMQSMPMYSREVEKLNYNIYYRTLNICLH